MISRYIRKRIQLDSISLFQISYIFVSASKPELLCVRTQHTFYYKCPRHSTFLEIPFTKLTKLGKLTNVHPVWSLCNKVCSNVFCKSVLECTITSILVYFLQSTFGCKYVKIVSLASLVSLVK